MTIKYGAFELISPAVYDDEDKYTSFVCYNEKTWTEEHLADLFQNLQMLTEESYHKRFPWAPAPPKELTD